MSVVKNPRMASRGIKNTRIEHREVDTAASAACVRSGAFALLLSVALLLLVPTWRAQPMYAALGEYLAQRVNLAGAMEDLDDDPVWRKYQVSNETAELMPIGQLREIGVDMAATDQSETTLQPKASAPPRNNQKVGIVGLKQPAPPLAPRATDKPTVPFKNQSGVAGIERPAPPSGLNVSESAPQPHPTAPSRSRHKAGIPVFTPAPPSLVHVTVTNIMGISEAPRILGALTKLNDSDILTRTRQVSNFFEFSLVRWLNKRNGYAFRNALTGICTQGELEAPPKGDNQAHFAPALTEEALMKCLTVHDARELARFELREVSNSIQLGGRIGPLVEIAPGSLPRGSVELYSATIAAQILLFFVVVYFAAFTREAVASRVFPAPGTLFALAPWGETTS